MRAITLPRVLSMSRRLAEFFHAPHRGSVLATYDRSCYLSLDGQIVALVAPALLNGPLNIVVDSDPWVDRVAAGAIATSSDRALQIDGGFELGLHPAAVWEAALRPWREEQFSALHGTLRVVQRLLDAEAPEGGLAHAVTRGNAPMTALETLAAPAIANLTHGLQRRDAQLMDRAAGGLAGLGPGLTPSGDDVLVGCLLALALRADDSHGLRQAIVSAVEGRTTRISMAYLLAAARGEANEAWHRFVDALAPNHPASRTGVRAKRSKPDGTGLAANDPDRIAKAARGVMAFGETSGSDMLAGFVLAVNALLA